MVCLRCAVCCAASPVGTLVSKTMLAAANAPYAAPAPGGTLVSLDVFSLQVNTERFNQLNSYLYSGVPVPSTLSIEN